MSHFPNKWARLRSSSRAHPPCGLPPLVLSSRLAPRHHRVCTLLRCQSRTSHLQPPSTFYWSTPFTLETPSVQSYMVRIAPSVGVASLATHKPGGRNEPFRILCVRILHLPSSCRLPQSPGILCSLWCDSIRIGYHPDSVE